LTKYTTRIVTELNLTLKKQSSTISFTKFYFNLIPNYTSAMKQLLTLLFVCLFMHSFAQDTLNQTDDNGKKQGHWIYYGKDRPESGVPLEGKVEEGNYIDDRKEGIWIKYNLDGVTPKLKGEYKNNRPTGSYSTGGYPTRKKYKNAEKGTFVNNQYRDSLIRFHSNGQVEYRGFYNQEGKEEGLVHYYYPNGQLEFRYNAINGIPTGTAIRYYENGDQKEIMEYDDEGKVKKSTFFEMTHPPVSKIGSTIKTNTPPLIDPKHVVTNGIDFKPNGTNKIYNLDNETWLEGDFKNGQLWKGKEYIYDREGILLNVRLYENGLYVSDGQL